MWDLNNLFDSNYLVIGPVHIVLDIGQPADDLTRDFGYLMKFMFILIYIQH